MTADTHGPFGRVVLVPKSHPRRSDGDGFRERLADWLLFMVPMFIAEQRSASAKEIERARGEALEQIASHGDDLQYGGRYQGPSRTALAKGIAILASAEGGITTLGVHACTAPHLHCPGDHQSTPGPAKDKK
ncbi:hypothetical protein ACFVUW_28860 [Streptomyces xiamenensis]|uniref:hypothetical protein n=1 Tax=Streptomyces xiamenensis TaxID=408015 RepID=UPI0036EED24D